MLAPPATCHHIPLIPIPFARVTRLLDTIDFDALIPDAYKAYAPVFETAVRAFVGALPEARLWEIAAAQADLGDDADPAERLVALARCCPVLHKIGQVMAHDRHLDPMLTERLQTLEVLLPSADLDDLLPAIEREIGPLKHLGVVVDEPPLAEASVAVVVPFRRDGIEGVFKLRKPGIEARMAEDTAALDAVGRALDAGAAKLGLPALAYPDVLAEAGRLLAAELRFDLEQARLAEAAVAFDGRPEIVVPEVYPELCSMRMTAMERLFGTKLTDAGGVPSQTADLLIETLLAEPLWSGDADALFHGDPHAGNLIWTEEGRLGLLDWSLAGTLTKAERVGLTGVFVGGVTLDEARVAAAIADGLATGTGDRAELDAAVHGAVDAVRGGDPPGVVWLTDLLDKAVRQAGYGFSPGLLLYRKAMKTCLDVARALGGPGRAERVLVAAFVHRFALEWPARFFAAPADRDFRTHLSNVDLQGLWAHGPTLLGRVAAAAVRKPT